MRDDFSSAILRRMDDPAAPLAPVPDPDTLPSWDEAPEVQPEPEPAAHTDDDPDDDWLGMEP